MKKDCDKKEKIKKIILHRPVKGGMHQQYSELGYQGSFKPPFFLQKDFTRTKSTKCIQANKNKKDSIFMCIKTSKRKKIACLTFCAFCVF